MIVSLKDSLKFVGISVVCFCAVFVCTFFLNFYLDVLPLRSSVAEQMLPLYNAQKATAKMVCAIAGGFLSVIAAFMLMFYIKLYIDGHRAAMGTLKAMGYSSFRIAKSFTLFGASVLLGCAVGFGAGWAFIPFAYDYLTIEGLSVAPTFHAGLFALLVPLPAAVFTAIAYFYSALLLRKPALTLMHGKSMVVKAKRQKTGKNRPFLLETALATLKSRKALAFFVAFSCFCFSAMVQMGLSMENLVSGTMGYLILAIGIVLAAVSMLMAMTSLIKGNAQNVALMKTMGFDKAERFVAIFAVYIPLALLGFAVGTIYQYGLLMLMVNVIFKDVGEVPDYGFDIAAFFITLAAFVACYSSAFLFSLYKANETRIKEVMTER